MPDYSNSRIYKIVDNTNGNIYIGSTTQSLSRRLAKHVGCYRSYLNNTSNFMTSFKIIENKNYDIILSEEVNCENKVCVNKNITIRTHKESSKIYRENNKE